MAAALLLYQLERVVASLLDGRALPALLVLVIRAYVTPDTTTVARLVHALEKAAAAPLDSLALPVLPVLAIRAYVTPDTTTVARLVHELEKTAAAPLDSLALPVLPVLAIRASVTPDTTTAAPAVHNVSYLCSMITLSGTCTSGLGVTQCQTTGAVCATDNKCRCLQGTFDSNGFGTAGGTCVSISNIMATSLAYSSVGTASVTIIWSAPATYSGQVRRYDVTWSEAGGGTRTGTTASSLHVTGLQSATTYNLYIKSIESGSWTADQEVTTTTPITVTTKSLLGDLCGVCTDSNAICSISKCVCRSGYYDNDGDTTNVGGTCTARLNPGESCPTSPSNACKNNSVCTGGMCTCNNGYYDSDGPSTSSGTCTARLNPGVTCNAVIPNACKDNSACSEGSCSCNSGYYDNDGLSANNGICTALIALSGTCSSGLGVTQCQTNGAVCATDNKCRCNQGTFDSNGFGNAGGTCVGMNNLMVTFLSSSNVGTTSVTISWSAPATYSGQVSRYDVVWTGGGTGTGTTATSLQVTGLQSATTYNFYIKSIESGSWTADQEVTTSIPITVTTKSLLGNTCGSCADPNAVCSTTCVCKCGYYDNDGDTTNVGGTCTANILPGEPCNNILNECTALSTCSGGICTCNSGYYDSGATCELRLNPGVACPVSPTNACKDNSICIGGVCTCNNGYYDSDGPSANNGLCTLKILPGESCNNIANECTALSTCSGGICTCNTGYYDSGDTCESRLNPGVSCPVSPTNACKDSSICIGGVCTCNNGYYDSDGPSANNGICTLKILPGESCNNIANECTALSTCSGGICTCNTGYYDSGDTCESRLNPGVACPVSPTNACKDNSICIGGVCTCNNGYYDSDGPSANNGLCTLKILPGESCNNIANECTALSTCSGGICTCNTGYYDSGDTCESRKACPSTPTNACKDDSVFLGVCTCNNGYYDSYDSSANSGMCTERLYPGVACPVSPTNACKDNSICIGGVCTCNNGYYDSDGPSANNGLCTLKILPGESCNNIANECTALSTCSGGICTCNTGYYDSGDTCESRLNPGVSCPVSPTNACKDNSVCIGGVCTCNNGYYDSDGLSANNGLCTLKILPGESCNNIANECTALSTCSGGTCICNTGYYDSGDTCESSK
ncbi:tenascin-X-like [Argopecten irradians]|uniref:tenascin-X-like n=1 Tax=Argopecten irradians TaxID=31199 RepID=UPI003711F885